MTEQVDFRPLIVRLVASRSAIFEVDQGLIFRYALPKVRASPQDILAAEERLGRRLEERYRSLLQTANGFPGLFGNLDLFGTDDLGAGPRWDQAVEYLEELRAYPAGASLGPTAMPIGQAMDEPSLLVLGSSRGPRCVTWLYGGEISERWPTVVDLLRDALVMNEQTLADLKGPGPLRDTLQEVQRLAGKA